MTGVIVDASVTVQWVVEEEHSRQATSLLACNSVEAPAHWLAEAANALWNKARRAEFDHQSAADRADWLAAAPVRSNALPGLMKSAISLSRTHDISVCDSLYVALGLEKGLTLVTADRKLVRRLREGGLGEGAVLWIGEMA